MTHIQSDKTAADKVTTEDKTNFEGTMFGSNAYQTIAGQVSMVQGGYSDAENAQMKEYTRKLIENPDRIEDYLATQSNRKDS